MDMRAVVVYAGCGSCEGTAYGGQLRWGQLIPVYGDFMTKRVEGSLLSYNDAVL
ncbi:hypothetical protein ALMA_0002 [Alloscardovia macacae]|uniref:Uncharacterized protein n=1 Tax=Alloscardovia macacae TaxID=1160091 RepID=A0A261F6A9_9BIFI|nr:hypothetical protein ALMA_0002 [Alloscardovia macacae]